MIFLDIGKHFKITYISKNYTNIIYTNIIFVYLSIKLLPITENKKCIAFILLLVIKVIKYVENII